MALRRYGVPRLDRLQRGCGFHHEFLSTAVTEFRRLGLWDGSSGHAGDVSSQPADDVAREPVSAYDNAIRVMRSSASEASGDSAVKQHMTSGGTQEARRAASRTIRGCVRSARANSRTRLRSTVPTSPIPRWKGPGAQTACSGSRGRQHDVSTTGQPSWFSDLGPSHRLPSTSTSQERARGWSVALRTWRSVRPPTASTRSVAAGVPVPPRTWAGRSAADHQRHPAWDPYTLPTGELLTNEHCTSVPIGGRPMSAAVTRAITHPTPRGVPSFIRQRHRRCRPSR